MEASLKKRIKTIRIIVFGHSVRNAESMSTKDLNEDCKIKLSWYCIPDVVHNIQWKHFEHIKHRRLELVLSMATCTDVFVCMKMYMKPSECSEILI